MGVTATTVRAISFLRRDLDDIDIAADTALAVVLPPRRHAATAEDIPLL